ncbi:MAG: LapA family protein [Acidimicrobiales bacterium]
MTHLPESIQDDSIERKKRRDNRLQIARLVGLIALAGIVAAFVVQNSQTVSVHFWFLSRRPPLIFVILGCIVIGVLVGYVAGVRRGRSTPRRRWLRKRDSKD